MKVAIWANEPVGRRDRKVGHDRPVVPDPANVASFTSSLGVREVAEIEREYAVGSERLRDGHERAVDRGRIWEVVQDVADGDDRVGSRDRVVGKHELADVLRLTRDLTRDVEHRRRRVGREHPMSGVEEGAW